MKKIYVLDTNVLLHDAHALFNFADNELVIPLTVLEELDKFKKNQDETGRNARQVSRTLDGLRAKGRLTDGVALESGGSLRVVACDRDALELLPLALKADIPDNRILAVAMWMVETRKELPVIFVTKDVNLRIKADTAGLTAQDYESDKVAVDDLYSGIVRLNVAGTEIDRFQGQGFLEMKEALSPNQCVVLEDAANSNHVGVGRYQAATNRVVPLKNITKDGVWGIKPRNVEQQFALDLLLDDNLQLVTINGKAGTGKTLLAIAVGLLKVADEKLFSRLLISRPIFPMGKDLGFLPGGVEEKLTPWMQPIFDNVDLLLESTDKRKRSYHDLVDMGILQIEPLTYIRGRSIPKQYMIVDEAQNLTPHEVKTIITRAGQGTKIVLTGDPYQIDNPYIDSSSNGLNYAVSRFRGQEIAGHVTLEKGERSPLAELAANLL